jgi:hypothetical protein
MALIVLVIFCASVYVYIGFHIVCACILSGKISEVEASLLETEK